MRRQRLLGDYLEDMLNSVEKIERFVGGMTFEQFSGDEKTVYAVTRALEIIGEASRHLPKSVRDKHAQIPWDKITGMRNILIHEYFAVNLPVIWRTIKEDIPRLKTLVSEALEEEEG